MVFEAGLLSFIQHSLHYLSCMHDETLVFKNVEMKRERHIIILPSQEALGTSVLPFDGFPHSNEKCMNGGTMVLKIPCHESMKGVKLYATIDV